MNSSVSVANFIVLVFVHFLLALKRLHLLYVCTYMRLCVFACTYISIMYICVYVCVYIYILIYICVGYIYISFFFLKYICI